MTEHVIKGATDDGNQTMRRPGKVEGWIRKRLKVTLLGKQTGPNGFLVVLPGETVEIPQDSDKSWLTCQQFGNLLGNVIGVVITEQNITEKDGRY